MVPEWVLYADIPAQAVRIYAALRRHANDDTGHAWPSRKRLADLTHTSPATVTRCLKALREIGAIEWVQAVTQSGDLTSNDYVIHKAPAPGRPPVTLPSPPAVDVGSLAVKGQPPMNGRRPLVQQESEPANDSHEPEPTTKADSEFDDFWSAFPLRKGRKVGKAKCLKLWAEIPTSERASVITAAGHYAQEAEDPAIMHPATFLTDDVWRDWTARQATPSTSVAGAHESDPTRKRMDAMGHERPEWRHHCNKCAGTGVVDGGDCDCVIPAVWLAVNEWIGPVPEPAPVNHN